MLEGCHHNGALPRDLQDRGVARFGVRGIRARLDEDAWRALARGANADAVRARLAQHPERWVRAGLAECTIASWR